MSLVQALLLVLSYVFRHRNRLTSMIASQHSPDVDMRTTLNQTALHVPTIERNRAFFFFLAHSLLNTFLLPLFDADRCDQTSV